MAPTGQCERCREWVSLDLDAELSEFEAAVLRRHLRTCSECRAFQRDLRALTSALRWSPAAVSELPVALPLARPVPARRRRGVTAQRLSVGAAAAAAAIAAVFGSGLGGDQRTAAVAAVGIVGAGNVDLVTLRAGRRAELHLPSTSLGNARIRVVEFD